MKILVADDDPTSRRIIEACLTEAGYDVLIAVDGAQALEMIGRPDSPRLLVLDRTMPHVDGLDVCRAIRKSATQPDVYIILLTGKSERQEIAEGFEAGADDYMTKPFDSAELQARVRTGARIVERQEELIASREQLRSGAMYDSLTGVINRGAFIDLFHKEVARAERYETPLAVIMADFDDFRGLVARYGQPSGEIVLVEAAHRLRTSLRVSDSIGRYGGETFAIVAPGCTANAAAILAERFRLVISSKPVALENERVIVTMSFGVAGTADMHEASGLLRTADEALSRAKHAGRNRVKGVEKSMETVKEDTEG
jgi:two-component system cell cycle response regulator